MAKKSLMEFPIVVNTPFFLRKGEKTYQVLFIQLKVGLKPVSPINIKFGDERFSMDFESMHRIKHYFELPIPIPQSSTKIEISFPNMEIPVQEITVNRHREWKVFCAFKTHYDLGYTKPIDVILKDYRESMFDTVADFCHETKGLPENIKFVWTYHSWILANMLENMDKKRQQELIKLIEKGQIEWAALPCHLHSYLGGLEELIRGMYYNKELEDKFSKYSYWAKQTDVPGHVWFFPQLLAKSGIKLLQIGCNNGVRGVRVPMIFYWEGQDGSKILTQMTNGYSLPWDLQRLVELEKEEANYPSDAYLSVYVTGDNCGPVDLINIPKELAIYQNRYEYPKYQTCNPWDFADYIERHYKDKIPVIKQDLTDWWTHGIAAMAVDTSIAREAKLLIPMAETLASICKLLFKKKIILNQKVKKAYEESLIYTEHTWGMHNGKPMPQPVGSDDLKTNLLYNERKQSYAVKGGHARESNKLAKNLLSKTLKYLYSNIKTRSQSIVVWNPTIWDRSDVFSISKQDLNIPIESLKDLESGAKIDVQKDGDYYVFIAQNVPSLGYKTFEIEKGEPALSDENQKITDIENNFYKIKVDRAKGEIKNILHKTTNRELLAEKSEYRFNQFIYEALARREDAGWHESPWLGEDLGVRLPKVVSVSVKKGSVFSEIIIESKLEIKDFPVQSGEIDRIIQSIRLYKGLDKIEVTNQLLGKKSTALVEMGDFCFPFALSNYKARLDILGAVIDPIADTLPDGNKDVFAIQHWADISERNFGITFSPIDSPLVMLGDRTLLKWNAKPIIEKPFIYAQAFNNAWNTNFQQWQGGDFIFRFSLRAHQGDWITGESAKFGWENNNKMIATIIPKQKGTMPSSNKFLSISPDNITLVNLKQAEDGRGYIIRLYELNGLNVKAKLQLPLFKVSSAFKTNLVEEDIDKLAINKDTIEFEIGAHSVESIRIL